MMRKSKEVGITDELGAALQALMARIEALEKAVDGLHHWARAEAGKTDALCGVIENLIKPPARESN